VVRGRGGGATAVQQTALPATPTARTAPSDSPIVLVAAGIIVVIVIGCRQGTATTAQQTAPLPLQAIGRWHQQQLLKSVEEARDFMMSKSGITFF